MPVQKNMNLEDPQFARNKPPDLTGDCRLMLRHALREGLELPPGLQSDLGRLDRCLSRCKLATLSNVSACLLGTDAPGTPEWGEAGSAGVPSAKPETKGAGTAGASAGGSSASAVVQPASGAQTEASGQADLTPETMILLFKVHRALSEVVAPATVASLIATEPEAGKEKSIFHGMPKVVRWAMVAAIICAVGYVVTAIPTVEKSGSGQGTNSVPASVSRTNVSNSSTR